MNGAETPPNTPAPSPTSTAITESEGMDSWYHANLADLPRLITPVLSAANASSVNLATNGT
jgi:hypothetical protein